MTRLKLADDGPLLCVDAPSLLYRAYYGVPKTVTGSDGRVVNALLGSVNMVARAVVDYQPRATVICFGIEAAYYRAQALESYHADRPLMPEELERQWELSPGLYQALDWYVATTNEFEADDLLHSYSCAQEAANGSTLLFTGDRDMFQSVSDRVAVLWPNGKGRGGSLIDHAGVVERYGIKPSQVTDFIALRGDPSDGIPGAKGIGAKTAATLLRRYGTLESTIEAAIRERPAVRAALIAQDEQLRMFKDLATLREIDLTLPESRPTNWLAGAQACEQLGMEQLAKRLRENAS